MLLPILLVREKATKKELKASRDLTCTLLISKTHQEACGGTHISVKGRQSTLAIHKALEAPQAKHPTADSKTKTPIVVYH